MTKEKRLPELIGDDRKDIAVLWEFLYTYVNKENANIQKTQMGCKKETVKFSNGRGRTVCYGIVPESAICATVNQNKGFGIKAAMCNEPGSAIIMLTENFSGIAEVSVFWSKEANGDV